MNSFVSHILDGLRAGDLNPAYEYKDILNDIALTIYNYETLDIPHLEDLKGILIICNICYNDTDREILPIEDGFYDLLLEKYKKYDSNFQVGAEVIRFQDSKSDKIFVERNFVPGLIFMEENDKDVFFLDDIVIDPTRFIDYRDFIPANPICTDLITKRLHDTQHNHPELVGTLDKCKFVLDREASERGVLSDSNVKTVERDFFQAHIRDGIINTKDQFDIILELKYDGISVEADCTDEVVSARSRGDTGIGKASDLTPILKGYKFPHRSKDAPMIGVKFEAIITQTDLPYFNAAKGYNYRNCRSAIVGLMSSSDAYKYRDFITLVPLAVEEKVYRIVCHSDRIEEINFLNNEFVSKGCPLRHTFVRGNYIENLAWINIFTKNAESMRYMVPFMYDGIVVSYRDEKIRQRLGRENFINKYSIAVKFNPLKKDTVFRGYSYTVGQDGSITPMIHYDPVEFYGTIHTKSSGHSFARFKELGLRMGNIISVEYVNDVMPYVSKQMGEYNSEIDMQFNPIPFPEVCPICGGRIVVSDSGKSAKCVNPNCGGRSLARMVNTCNKLELDGFGEATIIQLGFYHIKDIIEMALSENAIDRFMAKGFGPVESKNLINQLKTLMMNPIPISKVLGSIGFTSISNKTWELILTKISYDELRKMFNIIDPSRFYYNRAIEIMSDIKGIGPTTANVIAQEFAFFQDDIDYILSVGNVVNFIPSTGKKIVFSGFRDKALEDHLVSMGCVISDSLTKDSDLLIVASTNSLTTKMQKATKYGVSIVGIDAFRDNIENFI